MKDFIDNLVKEFLGRRIRERKEGVIFPSEIGYCLRRLYYLYKKPKEISFETLKLFESGNIVHGWFVNVLYSSYQKDLITSDISFLPTIITLLEILPIVDIFKRKRIILVKKVNIIATPQVNIKTNLE